MFAHLEEILLSYATAVPLSVFVPAASFFEEIVAPIPSPTIMLIAGSLSNLQGHALITLLPLALLGAIGKTLGATVVYTIADKAEDFIMAKFGTFFNVSEQDISQFREKMGTGKRTLLLLTIARSLPFVPSTLLSVGSGVIQIPLHIFIVATFLGSIIRDTFYLYAGYMGMKEIEKVVGGSEEVGTVLEIVAIFAVLGYLAHRFFKKDKRKI